jgi:hypothetical protein
MTGFVYIRVLLGILIYKLYCLVYYLKLCPIGPHCFIKTSLLTGFLVNTKYSSFFKKPLVKKVISKIITILISGIIIYLCRNNIRVLFLENVLSLGPILFIISFFTLFDESVKYIISNLISYIGDKLFITTHTMNSSQEGGSNSDPVPNLGGGGDGNESDDQSDIPEQDPSNDSGLGTESESEPESESESDSDESSEVFIPNRRASDYDRVRPRPLPLTDRQIEISNRSISESAARIAAIRSGEYTDEQISFLREAAIQSAEVFRAEFEAAAAENQQVEMGESSKSAAVGENQQVEMGETSQSATIGENQQVEMGEASNSAVVAENTQVESSEDPKGKRKRVDSDSDDQMSKRKRVDYNSDEK